MYEDAECASAAGLTSGQDYEVEVDGGRKSEFATAIASERGSKGESEPEAGLGAETAAKWRRCSYFGVGAGAGAGVGSYCWYYRRCRSEGRQRSPWREDYRYGEDSRLIGRQKTRRTAWTCLFCGRGAWRWEGPGLGQQEGDKGMGR